MHERAGEASAGPLNEPHRAPEASAVLNVLSSESAFISRIRRTRVMIGTGSTGTGGEPSTSPQPPAPSNVKPANSNVVFRNSTSPFSQRPHSMFGGEKISPNARPFSVIGSNNSDTITLTVKQWTEMNDKVSRLETALESQQEVFMKAIKELTSRLNKESERVVHMQHEIEKLTDLVTQV